ncbi:hypothetical protein [Nostoc sphaeroides]|uniref:Uncharacterized protein n=1 Tax=Nostoc sphaeroides CCNUC1 TaxID=2653204 RepID=A0A5P8W490_9NOSO|nr:hypothetical protein [Nostoc sphaeroides]MCC5631164.1 hypothetical protein [Nostoc sphaeroides CHAB 2801]QFS47311.1 hypothetical protein GXM_04801 [Nostoc sphaeroides CCNUC1]
MSSGSSGRYQSRLFNFVHQQSRRVTQQWEHTFRHLQVATKWGVEVLLYPVYLLFQSSESSGKTLQTKEPQTRLKLQPNDTDFQPEIPNVDSPIQHVLEAVNYLSSNEAASTPTRVKPLALLEVLRMKFADNKSTNNPNFTQLSNITENQSGSLNPLQLENALNQHLLVVRGIATNLMTRRLVLVTADNEILDILTLQQQAKLEDRIINEIANYWKSWRLIIAKQETKLLPQIDRLLARLTDGDTDKNSVLAEGIPKDLLNTDRLLEFIDIAVAKLESNALVPVQERSQEIVQVAQTQLNIFLYGKEQLAAKGKITANADGLETHTLNLQALIEAALNYFFGIGNRKTLESTTSDDKLPGKVLSSRQRKSLSKNSQLENQDLTDDPWLTWNDLFGDTETIAQKPVTLSGRTNPALVSSLSLADVPQNNLTVKQPKVGSGLMRRSQKTSRMASAKQTRTSISQSKSESCKGEILHQQFHQNSQVEAQPDWIETKATSAGYEKHPLEQLLEWVDYVMLWLEERFVKIFQSLWQLWQRK